MAEADFRITYEGGDADQNAMDMRLLALSMLGAERIMSDGLIVLINKRLPKRGERAAVVAKVKEPVAGSYELEAVWQAVFGLLPLGAPLAKELTGFFMEQWWKAVIAKFSDKNDVAEIAIKAMAEQNRDHLAARDASESRHHVETMAFIDVLGAAISGQQRSAEQFVAPIGPSVQSASIFPALAHPVVVGTSEADAIGDGAKLVWGPLEQLTVRTDGFRFHTNGLSIENPERDGFLMARVRDPKFEEDENPYTEAAQRRSEIVVLARRGYKDTTLAGIDIVDFIRDVPSSS